MKKVILSLYVFLYVGTLMQACVVSFGVPENLYTKNSVIMIYMQDGQGKHFVGKCHLPQTNCNQVISKNELNITEFQETESIQAIADITNVSMQDNQVIVLHVELDCNMKVLKILVVQDSFFADTMFDVLTLSLSEQKEYECNHHIFEEFDQNFDALDEFENLMERVDVQQFNESMDRDHKATVAWSQYMVYLELYMLMQYGRVKRAMQSWFVS